MNATAGMARRRRLHPHPQPLRRSSRLHATIQPTQASEVPAGAIPAEQEAGGARRRSPRLHPPTQASEEGASVPRSVAARRRNTQIYASEEASGAIRRIRRNRRGISPAAQNPPLEDDDLLWEILVRLPPQPSSLPRASAVCKRWRRAVTDPRFHRLFCAHHRKPPLLGFFQDGENGVDFTPVLKPPNSIPRQRFEFRLRLSGLQILGCRHGRLLIHDSVRGELVVIAPITGEERRVSIPSKFKSVFAVNGAVLCAAADHGHVHGSCHSSPFKVVLVCQGNYTSGLQFTFASVYSSATGVWSPFISAPTPNCPRYTHTTGSLVGNSLYWWYMDYILQFDLDRQHLAAIIKPPCLTNDAHYRDDGNRQIIQAMDGALGLAILSKHYHAIEMWQRKVNSQNVTEWVPWKTFEMHNILGLPAGIEGGNAKKAYMLGYAEDTDGIFLHVANSVYMVQLKSMKAMKLCETGSIIPHHSFESFYMPGATIARGCDEAEILHET